MSVVICIDLWRCHFEKEVIFWIRSNSDKLNFYLLWHRLESVMWFFPSYVERRKKNHLDKSPWLSSRCSVSFSLEKVTGCYGTELWKTHAWSLMLPVDFLGGKNSEFLHSSVYSFINLQLIYQGTKQNPCSHKVYILAGRRQ